MHEHPPNILWICSDQQRFDTLGCYGNPYVQTPNLDKLAQDGVLFEHAYSQSPVCTPSRASFLTGRYPRTTRCRQNGQAIPPDEVLVTKLLQDAGYVCGLAGKLHLAPCNPRVCKGTEQRIDDGYDQFFGRTIRLMLGLHMIIFNGSGTKDCTEIVHHLLIQNTCE